MEFSKFNRIIPPPEIGIYQDCLQQLAAGSEEAFNWLYTNHSRKIYEYALMLTGNEDLSEDLVQDVFSKIWEKRKGMAGVKNFTAYLRTITRNQINSHWRRRAIENHYLEQQEYVQAGAGDPYDNTNEVFEVIYQAIERLPKQQKLVYRLKREENWKKARIAEALRISPETVKAHMQKALRSIMDYVQRLSA